MSATREQILLAKRTVRLVAQRGAVRDTELAVLLGTTWEQTRLAIAITRRWGKVDYCGGFLVAVSPDEGVPAA